MKELAQTYLQFLLGMKLPRCFFVKIDVSKLPLLTTIALIGL